MGANQRATTWGLIVQTASLLFTQHQGHVGRSWIAFTPHQMWLRFVCWPIRQSFLNACCSWKRLLRSTTSCLLKTKLKIASPHDVGAQKSTGERIPFWNAPSNVRFWENVHQITVYNFLEFRMLYSSCSLPGQPDDRLSPASKSNNVQPVNFEPSWHCGLVKWVKSSYGFIQCKAFLEDIFYHESEVKVERSLGPRDQVYFLVVRNCQTVRTQASWCVYVCTTTDTRCMSMFPTFLFSHIVFESRRHSDILECLNAYPFVEWIHTSWK